MENAIDKLKKEMESNPDNSYVQYVGQYLIDRVKTSTSVAERILADGKTIMGSLDHMRKIASKVKNNKVAVLTPDEGLKAVEDYYEIQGKHVQQSSQDKPRSISLSLDELF